MEVIRIVKVSKNAFKLPTIIMQTNMAAIIATMIFLILTVTKILEMTACTSTATSSDTHTTKEKVNITAPEAVRAEKFDSLVSD